MFSKIFANFYVWLLTHNALQYLLFLFFLHFLDKMAQVFSASAQHVASWKVGIQDRTCFLGHTWKFPFVYSVNFCPRCGGHLKYKQTLKTHTRCMQLSSKQLSKTEVWKWRTQSIVNVSSGLCKGFIMNDQHREFYERTAVTCI